MPQPQVTWKVVLGLIGVVTGVSGLIVVGGGSALWLVEGQQTDSTLHSWSDALWLALTTMTTVGYGDHVPVTAAGRLIAAGVMVVGVAIIGAVAAVVALAAARRVGMEEERVMTVEADRLEHRLEARLVRIEAQLDALADRLEAWPPRRDQGETPSAGEDPRPRDGRRTDQ